MRFFTFQQNNSGGWLDIRREDGVGSAVCIEAENANAANAKARELDMFFSMYGECECCGPRWMEVDDNDGLPFPNKYGELIWGADHRTEPSFIHYHDGKVETVEPGDPAPDGWQQTYLIHSGYKQRRGA